jgi:thymidylate synthase (FAD)
MSALARLMDDEDRRVLHEVLGRGEGENILRSGHEWVLEHASFTFVLHNVSRVLTHELIRHRPGTAVSQESLRFVRLDEIPFWFPDWARADPELMKRATALLAEMEVFQGWMADHFKLDDEGVPFHDIKASCAG